MAKSRVPLSERFWKYVDKNGLIPATRPELGPCWIWLANISPEGYGRIGDEERNTIYAHRVAYELLKGPIPKGYTLDHLCRNRACPNPDHLEPVTQTVNKLRGESPAARCARQTHCVHGHEFNAKNSYFRGFMRQCKLCCINRAYLRRGKPAPHPSIPVHLF
jgi:hypothetical protein